MNLSLLVIIPLITVLLLLFARGQQTRNLLRESSQRAEISNFLARYRVQTGKGASFIRSMLNRLLTLRSGTAAISLR